MKFYLAVPLAVFCGLAVPSVTHAQSDGAINGTVMARADGSLLSNANIELDSVALSEPLETRSGPDGRFTFSRLVPGAYQLVVDHTDFGEQRYRLSLKPREVRNLEVELDLEGLTQAVVVTADVDSIPTTYSPSSTVIGTRRMVTLPLPQKSDLTDVVVTSAPGMIRGHDDFVHIRGSEIALNPFINGVSFWENPHALFSSGLGADYIESINVMTGGFSAEYGNRFGGVLDIVTKSGFRMNNEGSLTLGAGTALRHNASVEFGGHTDRLAYYIHSGAFESARFLSPPDPRAIHDTGRGSRAYAQFDFILSPEDSLKLVLMGDGTNFELPKTAQDAELRPALDSFQRTRSQSLILSWNHLYSADLLFETSLYQKWSRSRLLPNSDPLGAKADSERRLGTYGLKSDVTRFFRGQTLKAGVDMVLLRADEDLSYFSQPWIDYTHLIGADHIHFRGADGGPVEFQQKENGGQISVYVQDAIQLTPRLTADIGLRYDQYDLAVAASHFSPRLNLAYRLDSGTVLHGSYNHFFVPPPIENVLANSAGLTTFIAEIGEPLPPLRPIVEDQVELGLTQAVAGRLNLGLTGYYRLSNNPVHTVLFPDVRLYGYANFDKAKAYGMEVKAEMPEIPGVGVSAYLNYALGRAWYFNPVTAGFTTEAEHIEEAGRFLAPMDQTHTMTSGFTYRHGASGLWGSMVFEYGSGTPAGHGDEGHEHGAEEPEHVATEATTTRVPGHFTENLSIGWDAMRSGEDPRLTFQFNIENLSNNLYLVAQESVFTPGQYSIPRMYSGSVKIHF